MNLLVKIQLFYTVCVTLHGVLLEKELQVQNKVSAVFHVKELLVH